MDKPHHNDHRILLRRGTIRPGSTRRLICLKGHLRRRHKWQAWDLGRASCIINNHHHRTQTTDSRPRITISKTATRALMVRLIHPTADIHLSHLLIRAFTTQLTDHLR